MTQCGPRGFGKRREARGGAGLSPKPQGVGLRTPKEDQKPVGGVAGEEAEAQGAEAGVIVSFERDPREPGLDVRKAEQAA